MEVLKATRTKRAVQSFENHNKNQEEKEFTIHYNNGIRIIPMFVFPDCFVLIDLKINQLPKS